MAEEKAIRDAETAWANTVPTRDVDKVVAFYAEDAVMLPPGEAVANGKAAIRASWTQLLALHRFEADLGATKVEVAKSGDLAYDVGTYAMSYKDASGKAVNDIGKFSTVWRKEATGRLEGCGGHHQLGSARRQSGGEEGLSKEDRAEGQED